MKTIYFKGEACHVRGNLPSIGSRAPSFNLVGNNLQEVRSIDFAGKRIVLNIFPSLDTGVCAMTIRRFNTEIAHIANTVAICVSMDLPFAAARFCAAEGIKHVITASAFRSQSFAEKYGVQLIDGPLAGLLARAVVVIDKQARVIYAQMVNEITEEPDYTAITDILTSNLD